MSNNQVAQWEPSEPVQGAQSTLNPQVGALASWAEAAAATQQIAAALVQSSFVPAAFRGKPIEATAAILAGAEVGLQPMNSLKAFDVIQGAAAPRAITLRAIVQAAGHEIVLVESTTTRCRMKGRRRGQDTWQTVDWTIDRAKQLGVATKDNWRSQPQAMLVARATSELARLIAADAILGIGYSAEEIADGAGEPLGVTTSPQATPTKRVLKRSPKPKPEPAPAPTPTEPEPVPVPVEEMATPAQLQALNIALEQHVSAERSEKLDWLAHEFGRKFGSSKELTKAEASRAIDYWMQVGAGDPVEPEPEAAR